MKKPKFKVGQVVMIDFVSRKKEPVKIQRVLPPGHPRNPDIGGYFYEMVNGEGLSEDEMRPLTKRERG